ncbi:PorV/PorQ family protein [Neolewinella antarctica]|uniref:DUF3308 domain-containing protein n=1 Tax=Neolewinella antarctica TaxID=442734 RepID=A0ABX0X7Q5_9BACT|nr:PorV/PorQ family protein [Neolewinella antarctica]NJC25085.1 hypothetical protein [Neolewinella antarctica]
MNKIYPLLVLLLTSGVLCAGNPDRQGEAGAAQLLMNPWAPSAGLHSLNTSSVMGVEAMRINPAGLSRASGTNVMLGYANYLSGSDISMQAIGVSSSLKGGGAIGISLHSLSFGDVPVTTTNIPEGTGANLDLAFLNIGLTYSYTFEQKVSVGVTLRGVSEGTSDVSAFGFAIDAGIQYITGEADEFKFGVSLRNVGSRMRYAGQGLATTSENPDPRSDYALTFNQRAVGFEMPSILNIGASYDFLTASEALRDHRVTVMGNFTANSFSRDQLGGAAEYAFREQFVARVGYRTDVDTDELTEAPLYEGLSAGASVRVPFSKADRSKMVSFDYAFRSTRIYGGTHNVGLSLAL